MTYAEDPALGRCPLLLGLEGRPRRELLAQGVRRALHPGQLLFAEQSEASALYVLLSGHVRLTRAGEGGHLLVLHDAHPGDVLACAILSGASRYPASAEVLEPGLALAFDAETIRARVARSPTLTQNALLMLTHRMEELRHRLDSLTSGSAERRLAQELLRLHLLQGDAVAPLAISRQQLADLVGTNQYTVSRLVARWAREGWLEASRGQIRLLDPAALARLGRAGEASAPA